MITAVEAKQIQTNYLTSQCDIDRYMRDIEEAIKDRASQGGNSITINFNHYNLSDTVMRYAKMGVKEKLIKFGYVLQDGDFPFEIFVYW